MLEDRWLRALGPVIVSLGVVAAVGAAAGAKVGSAASTDPPPCDGGTMARIVAARSADGVAGRPPADGPWFELVPSLDPTGTLVGQRLTVRAGAGGAERRLDLPPESFAAGPFGRVVLVVSDDGRRSRLAVVDVAARCAWPLADEADVIRRATLSPDGLLAYETRVDRSSRADLGVWRRPVDGRSAAVRILGPIADDRRYGRTWSTELLWAAEGDRLAIQSCGAVACRTRILDPDDGRVDTVGDPADGPMVGLTGPRLIAYRSCPGSPCGLVAIDTATRRSTTLSDAAGAAAVVGRGATARVLHEWGDGLGFRHLRSVDPAGGDPADLGLIPAGTRFDPALVRRARTAIPTIDEVTR